MVGPAAWLLGMRHQERAARVFAGGRNIWYGGGTWAFCGPGRWAWAGRKLQGFGCGDAGPGAWRLVWWWDVAILRARAVDVGRAQIAGFWLWRRGSWGVAGFVDRK